MAPLVRFPSGPITPHGAYEVLHDRIPQMVLRSYDDTVVFNLLGGLAIADKVNAPERVEVKDLKGLIPPWRTIDQKGATQDGTTFIDALYDPIEVELGVRIKGRNPAQCRRVGRYLMDSIDAKKQSELSWFTHDLGRWWAPIRWFRTPVDPVGGIRNSTQELSLRLRADNGFWQSYPSVDQFLFSYEDMTDTFTGDFTSAHTLGPNWPQLYDGDGGGFCQSNGDQAVWFDDPDDTWLTLSREVINGPYKDFETNTDNQVINIVFGSMAEWAVFDEGFNDIWGRMGRDGSGDWDGNGVRVRIGFGFIRLSYFVNFDETILREFGLFDFQTWIPPFPGEKFTLVCGYEGDPRMFKIMRNGSDLITVKETGTGSLIGADYRGIGFGMRAGAALLTQATPAAIRKISAGDNSAVSQEGFLTRYNVGDQDAWDTFLCTGPGTFKFWDGQAAGIDEYVQFGPLLAGQHMFIRTDPRKYGVVDMTSIPPSPQDLNFWQEAIRAFLSFATGNNVTPLQTEIESLFGIAPPQGNPYSLLQGRFSRPIPAKSPGRVAQPYHVKVAIDDGNADSKIEASMTPLRRMPF